MLTALLLLPTTKVPIPSGPRNLKNSVPEPRNFPSLPWLTLFQPTSLLGVLQTLQACSHLRAFALAVSLVWINPFSNIFMLPSLLVCLNVIWSVRPLSTALSLKCHCDFTFPFSATSFTALVTIRQVRYFPCLLSLLKCQLHSSYFVYLFALKA